MHGIFLFKKTQPQSIIIVEWTVQSRSGSLLCQKTQPQQLIFVTNYYTVQSRTEKTTTAAHFYYNLLYSIVTHRKDNHSNTFVLQSTIQYSHAHKRQPQQLILLQSTIKYSHAHKRQPQQLMLLQSTIQYSHAHKRQPQQIIILQCTREYSHAQFLLFTKKPITNHYCVMY